MPLNIDLNMVPVESKQFEDDAALFNLKHKQITSIRCLRPVSSLIDENGIGDDAVLQLSSACFSSARCPSRRKRPAKVAFAESQSRRKCPVTVAKGPSRKKRPTIVAFDESQSRRKQPVIVVNNESLETDTSQSGIKSQTILKANGKITMENENSCESLVAGKKEDGGEEEYLAGTFGQAHDNARSGVVEEPVTKLPLSTQNLNTQLSLGRTIIDSNLCANENCFHKMNMGLKPNPFDWKSAPAPAPSKGLKIKCPVCLDFLNVPSSTICGHLFCQSCIATAISKQKMCPVCQKKLTKRNFHRIYI